MGQYLYQLILLWPPPTTPVFLAGLTCSLLCHLHALGPFLGAKVPGFSMSTATYRFNSIPLLVQCFPDLFNKPLLP